jgi:hypothetical protein
LLESTKRMNNGANFHSIVGGVFGATMQVLFMAA